MHPRGVVMCSGVTIASTLFPNPELPSPVQRSEDRSGLFNPPSYDEIHRGILLVSPANVEVDVINVPTPNKLAPSLVSH